jgi:hypothetical protein
MTNTPWSSQRPTSTPKIPSSPPAPPQNPEDEEHEGATEREVGDLTGPGAGYDNEPEQDPDTGGVS